MIKKLEREKIKEIGIICVCFVIIIIILFFIFREPVMRQVYRHKLLKKVKIEVLENIEYSTCKINGKYYNELILKVKDDFEDYEYSKKEETIRNIENKFNKEFKENEKKIIDTDDSEYRYDSVKGLTETKTILITKENKYESGKTLKRNDKEYSEKDYLKEKIIEQLQDTNSEEVKNSIDILNTTNYEKEKLNSIFNILDIKEKCNEIIYQSAKIYENNNYKKSIELYQKIPGYKDSNDSIEKINKEHEIDGEWYGKIGTYGYRWIINGDTCYYVYSSYNYKYTYDTYSCKFENNILYIGNNITQLDEQNAMFKMKYENGKLIYKPNLSDIVLNKESDNTQPKDIVAIKEPTIGMTKTEVENSTWGKPKDINKTTTKYGTREQWVYKGYKYIYFENGVVTSIQE